LSTERVANGQLKGMKQTSWRADVWPFASVRTYVLLLAVAAAPCLFSCAGGASASAPPDLAVGPDAAASDDAASSAAASCEGSLTLAPFEYQEAWGRPIASFIEGDEQLAFFDSCTLVRIDVKSGAVRGTRQVCETSDTAEAVARDVDGFWLASVRTGTQPNGRPFRELSLSKLDPRGIVMRTRAIDTGAAYEDLRIFPSGQHVALTATVERTIAARTLLTLSKTSFADGDAEAASYSDPSPDSNLFDVVRWRGDRIEGYRPRKRSGQLAQRYVVSATGELISQEDAPFYGIADGSCLVRPPRFFGHENTVFFADDIRFVALESTLCSADVARTAQVTMRSPAGGTRSTELGSITLAPDEQAKLCLGSPVEAWTVRSTPTSYALDRFRYAGANPPSFAWSVKPLGGEHPPCPIASGDGGFLVTVRVADSSVPGPDKTRRQVARLRCAN
jgi:hypothetical protein